MNCLAWFDNYSGIAHTLFFTLRATAERVRTSFKILCILCYALLRNFVTLKRSIISAFGIFKNREPQAKDYCPAKKNIVILISRPQDIALLSDICSHARQRQDIILDTWILSSCYKRDPGVRSELTHNGITITKVVGYMDIPWLAARLLKIDCVLNTRESTAGRYRLTDMIVDMANAAGAHTYTLQHGFENPGLTYYDDVQDKSIKFASRHILTWGAPESLPAWVSEQTRRKCIGVGCPKSLTETVTSGLSDPLPGKDKPFIAVFENLQWRRFDSIYISRFLHALDQISRQRTEFTYVLKSHPGAAKSRTSEITQILSDMDNVMVIDFLDSTIDRPSTSLLLNHAAAVITTPSTIAIDAALAGVPVALARINLELDVYEPLAMLDTTDDWNQFLNQSNDAIGRPRLLEQSANFLQRAILPGNGSNRVLDVMTASD